MIENLIAESHLALAADESLTEEFFGRLKGMMRACRLLYGGREIGVSLRPHLLTRAQYAGLVRASEVVAGALEKLAAALGGDYIVQERVELCEEEFPIFDERGWAMRPMYVDTNPFLFRGRVEGAMVRLSASPVVNVTAGRGETGFFVIEGAVGNSTASSAAGRRSNVATSRVRPHSLHGRGAADRHVRP